MPPPSPNSPSFRSGEHGFTLVEMLVTLVTGILVTLATLSVLDISISQSSRISERVDADQRGRLVMERIIQDLHSSCTSFEATPVLKESTAERLELISQPSAAAYLTKVTKHVISYSEATHSLIDTTYASTNTAEELGVEWKFPPQQHRPARRRC